MELGNVAQITGTMLLPGQEKVAVCMIQYTSVMDRRTDRWTPADS